MHAVGGPAGRCGSRPSRPASAHCRPGAAGGGAEPRRSLQAATLHQLFQASSRGGRRAAPDKRATHTAHLLQAAAQVAVSEDALQALLRVCHQHAAAAVDHRGRARWAGQEVRQPAGRQAHPSGQEGIAARRASASLLPCQQPIAAATAARAECTGGAHLLPVSSTSTSGMGVEGGTTGTLPLLQRGGRKAVCGFTYGGLMGGSD